MPWDLDISLDLVCNILTWSGFAIISIHPFSSNLFTATKSDNYIALIQ
jgi:hypothetical protein